MSGIAESVPRRACISTPPELAPYWRPGPPLLLDSATRAAFDALLSAALAQGAQEPIAYTLAAPKWQFLCYVAEVPFEPMLVHTAQLVSLESVRPRFKLRVSPEDFPFLGQMLAHDDHRLAVYAEAMQQGAPWPDPEPYVRSQRLVPPHTSGGSTKQDGGILRCGFSLSAGRG